MSARRIFVAGIGTGVGKTVACAALAKYLDAEYWKPVQCGNLADSDSITVSQLVGGAVKVHPEGARFETASSPHAAAMVEGRVLCLGDLKVPQHQKTLIIEGVGGLLVPLNDRELCIDMVARFEAEVILISMNYLGSINHTLLSLEAIKARGLPLRGVIFNGEPNSASESAILSMGGTACLGRLAYQKQVTSLNISGMYTPSGAVI